MNAKGLSLTLKKAMDTITADIRETLTIKSAIMPKKDMVSEKQSVSPGATSLLMGKKADNGVVPVGLP